MTRPARKHAHLVEKIAETQSKSIKKPGKRLKRWKKWAEHYKALLAG
ncbi:MAG TPA: hypothetical protein VGM56_03460 [Byssovorax sp.]|jgi:hypothetical protein